MKPYRNRAGNSGVVAYDIRPGSILVEFQDGWTYEYTNASAGSDAVTQMQQLAEAGRGLSTFISTRVRDRYARRFQT